MRPGDAPHVFIVGRLTRGDAAGSVGRIWREIDYAMHRTARKLTDDPEEQCDLLQEAMIKLWELDPSRFDPRNNVDMFFARRMLINRMWDVMRTEWWRRGLSVPLRRSGARPPPPVHPEIEGDASMWDAAMAVINRLIDTAGR